ncbi:MAG TPA: winged helix-turn-helix domain-containing protein [Dokdonella sp.]
MSSPERYRPRYRFGEFALDPAKRELRQADRLLALSPKVFDCIAYLLAHRDRAVGQDELAATVWGRADVTDAQLRQLVRKARRIVGGDGDQQAVIHTIAHFGFRWVAETAEEDAAIPPPHNENGNFAELPAAIAPVGTHRVRAGWRVAAYACAALAIAALGIGALAWTGSRNRNADVAPAATSSAAIGVLPAEVEAGTDANATWMRLGLMDFVAGRLRKASVPVVASSDIVALSHGDIPADDLAARVRSATGAARIVAAFALRQPGGWTVRLALREGNGAERTAQAHSPDALLAAREASDRLLELLGKSAQSDPTDEPVASSAELLQRVEAALLTYDFGTARRLIESASPAMHELPEIQLDLARIESATDKDDAARARLAKLLSSTSAEDDPALRARALTQLGFLDALNPETSISHYSEAIELLGKLDDPMHLGEAYLGRGITYSIAERVDEARSDYARARMMFALANDSLRLAQVDNDEAALDSDNGRGAEALPLLERAAGTMERFGAIDKLITPVCNQVMSHLDLLEPAKALAVYERMRPKVIGAESQESLHFLDYTGAVSLIANGRLTEARSLLAKVTNAADPKEEAGLIALIDGLFAQIDLDDGKFDATVTRATRSLGELSALHRFKRGQADVWLTLTRALRGAGDAHAAESQTRQFVQWTHDADQPAIALRVRLAEAEHYWSSGQRPLALETYEAATQAADRVGTPYDIRVVAESYAGMLLDAGDLANATTVIGRIARWASSDFDSALLEARLYQALGRQDAWRAALENARALAGERSIPAAVRTPPPTATTLAQAQR